MRICVMAPPGESLGIKADMVLFTLTVTHLYFTKVNLDRFALVGLIAEIAYK